MNKNQKGLGSILILVGAVIIIGIVAAVFILPRSGPPNIPQPGWGQRPGGAQDFGGPPQKKSSLEWPNPNSSSK